MTTTQTNSPRPADQTAGPTATVMPAAGATTRQEFGGQSLAVFGDIGIQRAEAEARALVQARYIMAIQRPRDLDDVRVRIMREVERPGFAAVAYYRKPIGKGVEGLSVRFAEAAARCMGNLSIEPETKYEDAAKRVLKVVLTDLETNFIISLDATIEKTVERKSLADGRVAISVRKNSEGDLTYLVPATEDEMLGKANSITSKLRRNLILQVLPGDIAAEAKARIMEIRRGLVAKDHEGARKKVVDAFALLNVLPSELKRYLGHDIASASPAEIADLRDLYSSIAAGDATWAEAIAEKLGDEPAQPPKKAGLDGVTETLEQKAAAARPEEPVVGKTPADPKVCQHPGIPKDLAPGAIAVCTACGSEVVGEPPAAIVEDIKKLAGRAGDTMKPASRQGRLKED